MPTRTDPSTTIAMPNSHGWRPVMLPKAKPRTNNITMAIALDARRAGPTSCMKMNGIATGNVERNTRTNTPSAPSHSSLPRRARCRRLGQLHQPLPHRLELRRFEDRCDQRRQRVGDATLCRLRIGGSAHRVQRDEAAALFGEAAHQVQHRVDDAPGDVAPERADQHGADIFAAGLGDAERAGEREDHDQPEEHLGNAVDRIEQSLRGFGAHATFRRQHVERHGEDRVDHQQRRRP